MLIIEFNIIYQVRGRAFHPLSNQREVGLFKNVADETVFLVFDIASLSHFQTSFTAVISVIFFHRLLMSFRNMCASWNNALFLNLLLYFPLFHFKLERLLNVPLIYASSTYELLLN